MDAWSATLALIASWVVLLKESKTRVFMLPMLVAILAVVSFLQGIMGLVLYSGTAWIGVLYFSGLSITYTVGQECERKKTFQVIDIFFVAVVIAAFISVGIQLHQWLGLDEMDIWSMGPSLGRPFANFGQPNQLASFLFWGILAIAWGYIKGLLRPAVAVIAILFLVWGIALTHSRTAWIALMILNLAGWYWREYWPNKKLPWILFCVSLYFICSAIFIGWFNVAFELNLPNVTDELGRMGGEIRPRAWLMFIDAVLQKPWFGYGMNQVAIAQLMTAPDHQALFGVFSHSHNLFLDFCLWFGLPIGLLASTLVLRWLWQHGRAIKNAEEALLFLALIIMCNHAMLELPLHYAYFLLPTGLIAGVLNTRLGLQGYKSKFSVELPRVAVLVLLSGVSILFVLVVRDYFRVENSYRELRFELANFKYQVRGTEPDVVILTQWRDYIRMARTEPMKVLNDEELQQLRNIVSVLPSPGGMYKLAAALALRQQTEEADLWLKRLCKTQAAQQCTAVRMDWLAKAKIYPELAKIDWKQISVSQ